MVLNRQKRENFKPGNQLICSEAAREIKPKAPQPLSFSRVQVGVPLSSKCPNLRSDKPKLSLQLLFSPSWPNENLPSPRVCWGIYLRNEWCLGVSHSLDKIPAPASRANCPCRTSPQGCVTPPGAAQGPGTGQGSYPAGKTEHRQERGDVIRAVSRW